MARKLGADKIFRLGGLGQAYAWDVLMNMSVDNGLLTFKTAPNWHVTALVYDGSFIGLLEFSNLFCRLSSIRPVNTNTFL